MGRFPYRQAYHQAPHSVILKVCRPFILGQAYPRLPGVLETSQALRWARRPHAARSGLVGRLGRGLAEGADGALGLSVWQPGAGSEDVFVVDDAVFGERVLVAGVGPDRVRLVAVVDDQSAVVAVEAGLDAVRWCEHRRQDVEGVGQLLAPAAGGDVVGVGQAGAGVAGRRVASLVGVAGGEPGRRCGVLIRDPPGPVVAVTNPIRWYAWVVGADCLIVLLRRQRPVDDREVMVQPAVGVDGPPLSPGQPRSAHHRATARSGRQTHRFGSPARWRRGGCSARSAG